MKYSPLAIANYFLRRAATAGDSVTPMKLQKLVYYANGWHMGYTGQPLINEPIEAWQYGPVIPSLYHALKKFGGGTVTSEATDFNPSTRSFVAIPPPTDPGICQFLDNVWTSYGQYTGLKLSEMTHAPGGPWEEARKSSPGMRGVDIPPEMIETHFREAVSNSRR